MILACQRTQPGSPHKTVEGNSSLLEALRLQCLEKGLLPGLVCPEEAFVFEYCSVLDAPMAREIRNRCSSWR